MGHMQQMQGMQMRREPPSTEEIVGNIMTNLDTDGDGSISSDELSTLGEMQQSRLLESDSDGSGSISENELMSKVAEQIAANGMMGAGGPPPPPPPPGGMEGESSEDMLSKILEETDSDEDGVISSTEASAMNAMQQEFLNSADSDKDGSVTTEELQTHLEQGRAAHAQGERPPGMEDMSLNSFKDLLGSLIDSESTTQDTVSQIQDYLGQLGLERSEIDNFMTLLSSSRLNITA
jgi:Ca2+-binding EF-hand superfamily protein